MRPYLLALLLAGCLRDQPTTETPDATPAPAVTFPAPDPGPQPLTFSNGDIVIVADPAFAYAITSLTYRGIEFVNASDHGREIQSALSFDDLGECFNPTEAGNSYDHETSSSVVLQASSSMHSLTTQVDAAFWLLPDYIYFGQCGTAQPPKYSAQNKGVTGGYLIGKSIKFCEGINGCLTFILTYTIPEAHKNGTFEFTGYLERQYKYFYTFDPGTGQTQTLLADDTKNIGEQPLPIILSDGMYAMGVYSPTGHPGYGRWAFSRDQVNKLNVVWRSARLDPGDIIHTVVYVCIGEMETVKECLRKVAI